MQNVPAEYQSRVRADMKVFKMGSKLKFRMKPNKETTGIYAQHYSDILLFDSQKCMSFLCINSQEPYFIFMKALQITHTFINHDLHFGE